MFGILRRYSHFIFAVIQAGLTCLVAAGIASLPLETVSQFLTHWLLYWAVSWVTMLPVVVLAAPMIRSVSVRLTSGESRPAVNCGSASKMSALGQKPTFAVQKAMSALPPKATLDAYFQAFDALRGLNAFGIALFLFSRVSYAVSLMPPRIGKGIVTAQTRLVKG